LVRAWNSLFLIFTLLLIYWFSRSRGCCGRSQKSNLHSKCRKRGLLQLVNAGSNPVTAISGVIIPSLPVALLYRIWCSRSRGCCGSLPKETDGLASVVGKSYIGLCRFNSCLLRQLSKNSCRFYLAIVIQDAVVRGYFVSTQGRNSAVAKCGKAIRFDSGADTPRYPCRL
jgi:hypothetical protein